MTATGQPRSIVRGFQAYGHPRVLAMLFLGFSAGLPFPLVFTTLTAWLATADVSKSAIGLFGWISILYGIKVLWAPIVDRLPLPGLTRWLGRRRAWMFIAQIGVAISLAVLSRLSPLDELAMVAVFALFVAFFSATQDICIDAYRIEAVEDERQGAMAASYQLGYRVAVLAGSAGALYIADFIDWEAAYQTMALLMVVGLVTVLVIDEPDTGNGSLRDDAAAGLARRLGLWLEDAVAGPFRDFFRRNGWWALVLLAFIGTYHISDRMLGIMAMPFYLELGYSLSEIATIAKVFGFAMTLIGAGLGGLVVGAAGVERPLVYGAAMLAATNLFFAGLAAIGEPDVGLLTITIAADNFSLGFSSTLLLAYLASLTNTAYTATQYALFSSLMSLPGKFFSGFSGLLADSVGWVPFFIYVSLAGVPAIALAIAIRRRSASR